MTTLSRSRDSYLVLALVFWLNSGAGSVII